MLSQVERDAAALWLQEPAATWSDELGSLPALGPVAKRGDALFAAPNDGLLDKLNDDKLARDVEDLSAIFEELEGGYDVDFPLPCDEDVATGAEVTGDWIGDLEKDVVNVDELSSMFDTLVNEQAAEMMTTETATSEDDDDESMDEEYSDEDGDDEHDASRGSFVPAPPTWATAAPLDPRSVIRTDVFKNLDSRIPRVAIPRMDLGFGAAGFSFKPVHGVPTLRPVASTVVTPSVSASVSPKKCQEKKLPSAAVACGAEAEYRHDPASCWICKSDKSPYKKYALHRYLEKRHRRNWKRGPRYSGRSHVATNRVREGGRFVTTAHWV